MIQSSRKPKQIRRRRYQCCDCGEEFYALPQTFECDEAMCDDCIEMREQEEDDEIMRIIKEQIASYNRKQKQTK
jgi:late competence protein required for DNA uptake (superfamily II DNA/RNA helicase)